MTSGSRRSIAHLGVDRASPELACAGVKYPIVAECCHRSRNSRYQAERTVRRTQFRDQPKLAADIVIDRGELAHPLMSPSTRALTSSWSITSTKSTAKCSAYGNGGLTTHRQLAPSLNADPSNPLSHGHHSRYWSVRVMDAHTDARSMSNRKRRSE